MNIEMTTLAVFGAALAFAAAIVTVRLAASLREARVRRNGARLGGQLLADKGMLRRRTVRMAARHAVALDRLLLGQAMLGSPAQRSQAVEASARTGRTRAYLRAVHSPVSARRAAAATALRWLGSPDAVPEMLTALRDQPWSRETLVTAQAVVEHSRSAQEIRSLMLYLLRYPNVSPRVVASVAAPAQAPIAEVVAEFLLDDDETLRLAALEILRLRPALAAGLEVPWEPLMHHANLDIRCMALRLYIEHERAMPAVGSDVLSADAARAAIAGELWRLHPAQSAKILQKMLEDRSWWVRQRSAQSLGRLGALGLAVLQEAAARSRDRYAGDVARDALAALAMAGSAGVAVAAEEA